MLGPEPSLNTGNVNLLPTRHLAHCYFICACDEVAAEYSRPLREDVVLAVFGFGVSVEVGSDVHLLRESHWTPLRRNEIGSHNSLCRLSNLATTNAIALRVVICARRILQNLFYFVKLISARRHTESTEMTIANNHRPTQIWRPQICEELCRNRFG